MERSRACILVAQADGTPALLPILNGEGYQVERISDPGEERRGFPPNLIVIDSVLPNAFPLCSRLHQAETAPILMIVANEPAQIDRAFDAGASDVLLSPVYPVLLVRRVQEMIEPPILTSEQSRFTAALRATAAALSSTLDQNEVLDRILEQTNVVVPSHSANIMLIEDGIARVVRSRGYEHDNRAVLIDRLRFSVRDTPTFRWMIEQNRALVIPNVDDFREWQLWDATVGWLKSYVSAPVRIDGTVIGFLNIDSATPNRFSAADGDQLQIFADQAAIAIRNARLFDQVRQQAADLEQRVRERTAELDYERSQMRAIVDAMTEGVAYTEYVKGTYHIRYVNQALEQMTGYPAADWHLHALALFRGKNQSASEFDHLLDSATVELRQHGYWRHEARLARKDGSEFDASMITTRLDGSSWEKTGLVTVIRDVSQEKALQQQKERFVAYASHELRTPITNLKTRLYLMHIQPERMEEHMRILDYVTDRMKRLVEDLLDISRFERGVTPLKFENVVLQDTVCDLVQIQEPEAVRKGVQIACHLPEAPVTVRADADRLAQVITNLISNAINYTPSGGRIDVRLSQTADSRVLVEVVDTGIGIAADHLPHIFQPFYRVVSQIEGSGLGLSITKEIVELHGGEIEVVSQIGVGSTFRFWLPSIATE